ncbi:MAG: hypothetical protein M1824_005635 [Vezdaea acicularis]|nr:MAG: hypothetical protein M1824_005635 [Vezdaea acicularis]
MDILLGKITQQAMNYAIRSGITITSGYAIRECSRLLKAVDGDVRDELGKLQRRLEGKIRIISPAIDMIELISARGNTSLESAVTLTKALRWDIQSLGIRLAKAANAEELSRRGSSKAKSNAQNNAEIKLIIQDIKQLLTRIEDAVPLINLAITTSGASLSTSLPATISPSRLLQASTFLTAGDSQFSMLPGQVVQVGPAFILSLYMLFSGHANRPQDEEGNFRNTTWKEVIHKAKVKLNRVPLSMTLQDASPVREQGSGDLLLGNGTPATPTGGLDSPDPVHIAAEARADEYAYQIAIIEDLDDDRIHTFENGEEKPGPFDDVALAGIRGVLPVHEISKIFYADTGKILNIGNEGEVNNPVLLLKRDINAVPPRRMIDRINREPEWWETEEEHEENALGVPVDESQSLIDAQLNHDHPPSPTDHQQSQTGPWTFPPDLDPEWLAFEVYTESPDSDSESESELTSPSTRPSRASREPSSAPSPLTTNRPPSHPPNRTTTTSTSSTLSSPFHHLSHTTPQPPPLPPIKSSLSLLETLIRLTALQQFQQTSHLAIHDELLNFFLAESSTTGAGPDPDDRRRKRASARHKLGFDPYDESPVKRRGEDYLSQQQQQHPHQHRFQLRQQPGWEGSELGSPVSPTSAAREGTAFVPRTAEAMSSSPILSSRGVQRGTSPTTPFSTTRETFLRRGEAPVRSSPLGRAQSADMDSTLGTSPLYEQTETLKGGAAGEV